MGFSEGLDVCNVMVTVGEKRFFIGKIEVLKELISYIRDSMGLKIYGYVVRERGVQWGEIKGLEDVPLNIEDYVEPGLFRVKPGFRFRHSFVSPKILLHPPQQLLIAESKGFMEYRFDEYGGEGVALFGIKSCDLEAIGILDKVLLGKHPVYTARRGSVKLIIVEDCLEPNGNCFCALTGTGPVLNRGFDLSYARLNEDLVLFRIGSSVGEEILRRIGVGEAGGDDVSRYLRSINESIKAMKRGLNIDLETVTRALKSSIRDESLWRRLSKDCLGCGNCNFVCPTCFCIELNYVVVNNGFAEKIGVWTGCLLYSYGLVALSHFRRELYMRYRHFILHKFLFYPKQIGRCGCTGCGRCITWCPMGLDIRRALEETVKVV